MNEGDILVAPELTPEHTFAILKAAAIVTIKGVFYLIASCDCGTGNGDPGGGGHRKSHPSRSLIEFSICIDGRKLDASDVHQLFEACINMRG